MFTKGKAWIMRQCVRVAERWPAAAERWHWFLGAAAVLFLVWCVKALCYSPGVWSWGWTDRRCKTSWEWADLLIVPAVLVLVSLIYSFMERQEEREIAAIQREQDQTIADDRRKQDQEIADKQREQDQRIATQHAMDDALKSYLDAMGELLTDKGLGDMSIEPRAHVCKLARAYTLNVMERLDGGRKGQVVMFLYEARMLEGDMPRVSLQRANLSGIALEGAYLAEANLAEANLAQANLRHAFLQRANLGFANLEGADMTVCKLPQAKLGHANLTRVNLSSAYVKNADLNRAILIGASMRFANLAGAFLEYADLTEACLEKTDFLDANLEAVDLQAVEFLTVAQLVGTQSYRDAKNLPRGLPPDRRPWPRPIEN